jgi:hypothetical protein
MAVATDSVSIENLKGAIALGSQTLKSLEIINGGAVLAILTFYGSAVKDNGKVPFDKWELSQSLVIFAIGLTLAVAASCAAYIGQRIAATSQPDTVMDETARLGYVSTWTTVSTRTLLGAVVLALLSLLSFVVGTAFCGASPGLRIVAEAAWSSPSPQRVATLALEARP